MSTYQRQMFSLRPAHLALKYAYRAKYYPEPPVDWAAPTQPCWQCKRLPKELWAGWKWNGYHWECAREHD